MTTPEENRLPGIQFTDAARLREAADESTATLLGHMIAQVSPKAVGFIERTGAYEYRHLPPDLLSEHSQNVGFRMHASAHSIETARIITNRWLEAYNPDELVSPTVEEIMATIPGLGQLASIEHDFMNEITEQATEAVRNNLSEEDLYDSQGELSNAAMIAYSHEVRSLVAGDKEREARLAEMTRLSQGLAYADPKLLTSAALGLLRSTPDGEESIQELHDAALLQQDYEAFINRYNELPPLELRKAIASALRQAPIGPDGRPVPLQRLMRLDCPTAVQNFNHISDVFMRALLGEGIRFAPVTETIDAEYAYAAYRRVQQSIVYAAGIALTHNLTSFVEQTAPKV